MKTIIRTFIIILVITGSVCAISTFASAAADLARVDSIMGVKGQIQEGSTIYKLPRNDIKVTIDGEAVPTALGFGGWTAWTPMGNDVMVMGDLVLLQEEINPVISALAEASINVNAIHNHFLRENPRIMYMHIDATGNQEAIARGLRNALDKTGTLKPQSAATEAPSVSVTLNTARIEEVLGQKGQTAGGVFKVTIGRTGVTMHGTEVTSAMGLNTWAAFMGTDQKAHVAGDVVMTSNEVNRVIRALRSGGIEVLAVHNHMLDEQPRIFFLHYWGTGPAEKLAQTLRKAFDEAKGPVK